MLGSHLSIAGGLHNALLAAQQLDTACVQVFTKNQRQWRVPPLTEEQIKLWHDHRKSTGIKTVVSHDSYLINLANPDDEPWEKSIDLFEHELTRCEQLDIPYLVAHPGAHVGSGEPAGLQRIADALDRIHKKLPKLKTLTCLEVTAGQGTNLGARFEHLRHIIDTVKHPDRLAICLDTAHMLAAGYDLTSPTATRKTLKHADHILDLDRVKVLHINDSKTPMGSRVDRHAHIGQGHIPLDSFKIILNHPKLNHLPMILETAKESAPNGHPWDEINLQTLRALMKPKRPRNEPRA